MLRAGRARPSGCLAQGGVSSAIGGKGLAIIGKQHPAYRTRVRLIVIGAVVVAAHWLLIVGHLGVWRMDLLTERRLDLVAAEASSVARAGAQALDRHLHALRTVPELLAGQERFGRIVAVFEALAGPAPRSAWPDLLQRADFRSLSAHLAVLAADLDLDGIYVTTAPGFVVASSDSGTPHSHLGFTFAGSGHVAQALEHGPGEQFRHDLLSGRPTFFFSHRIGGGQAEGTIVVAVSSERLMRRIDRGIETVLVSDPNNIVVIASDRGLIYRHVGNPNPAQLSVEDLTLRYGRGSFDPVPPELFAAQATEIIEHGMVYASAPVAQEDMSIHVTAPVPALLEMRRENLVVVIGLVLFGLLLVAGTATVLIQLGAARERATRDHLTGLSNRRYADEILPGLLELDDRGRLAGFTFVSFDLDRFKGINDAWGHQVGDRVLVRFAAIMMATARRSDLVFRLGGEEFAAVLIEEDIGGALAYAERVRAATEAIRDVDPVPPGRITVSAGVAKRLPGESFEALAERADALLYRAKQNGRNRIECDDAP